MDEKALLGWKEANEEVYSKFKQDLEEQLRKPYHQTILDMGDGNAELLKSVVVNLAAIASKDDIDVEKLYTKAVKESDTSAYCMCCYLLFDNGANRLAKAIEEKSEEPGTQEIIDAVEEYKRFHDENHNQETAEITSDELNLLTLRRWHYDHPQEYDDFTATFQKAYDGDMTFINNNFFLLMEFMSFNGVKGMMKIVAILVPGNKHYERGLTSSEDNPLKGRMAEMLDSSLNNEAIREKLLHKNPYLFSLYYWLIFDDGYLHAADLISQTFLKPDSPAWQKMIGRKAVEALISTSVDKAKYSKAQWKDISKQIKKGDAKQVIDAALLEVQGRRGRKKTYVVLEEMLSVEDVHVLIEEIEKVLSEWKQFEETDSILAYIFAALVKGELTNEEYNYRTFHSAMREKFPNYHVSKGFDWCEALYNAIMEEKGDASLNISWEHTERSRKYADKLKRRLLSAVKSNIE